MTTEKGLEAILRRQRIIDDVEAERDAQDEEWGGPEHDDGHAPADWAWIIFGKLRDVIFEHGARRRLVQIAALCVAAIEALDRLEASGRPPTKARP